MVKIIFGNKRCHGIAENFFRRLKVVAGRTKESNISDSRGWQWQYAVVIQPTVVISTETVKW